jgi:energy-coupling factor transporter transmembrane protein EcfT
VLAVVVLGFAFSLLAGGAVLRAIAAPAVALTLPIWLILFLLHGVMGDAPRVALGPVALSGAGLERAVVMGGRLAAIVLVSLVTLAAVSPARLVEAMTERGVPFARIFLLVSTLTFLPRTRARAAQILEAQQLRGLRLGGSPVARLRALGPLVLPLVLGALAEVDEQVLALESRGAVRGERSEVRVGSSGVRGERAAGGAPRRTALDPPPDSAAERVLRWGLWLGVVAAYAAKLGAFA